ncbi:MAG: hypothetical protein ACSLEZ_07295 [Thiobacillus sp.]
MLYKDPLQSDEFIVLARERGVCVSLYLPTTPLTQDAQADRIVLKNLGKEALEQVEAIADVKAVRSISDMLEQLQEDDEFWSRQAYGLGVLLSPDRIRTYRLAYSVEEAAEVSDRFHLKPLVPALRPQSAWVLAISQKSVRLFEFMPSQELVDHPVPDMPKDFSDATGRTLQRDRAPSRKLSGDEGHKVLQTQFIRVVEASVREVVRGSGVPLVLATTSELQAIYRSLNHYNHLSAASVEGSVENLPVEDLRQAVVPLVRDLRRARIEEWATRYDQFKSDNRSIADLASISRLASRGQVASLLVDADAVQYGVSASDGKLEFSERRSAATYDLLDEVTARVLEHGGDVLAVRKDEEAPTELRPIATILRWA